MGYYFLLIFYFIISIISLFSPWIGVAFAYLVVILFPQAIWWWHFQYLRPFFYIAIPTIIGFFFSFLRGQISFMPLKTHINLFLFGWYVFIVLSYLFGPYVNIRNHYSWFNPYQMLLDYHKIFIFYFISCLLIDSKQKLRWVVYVLIFSSLYLIYWANSQYLSGHYYGRLSGPVDVYGRGLYKDQNDFAMFFVVALPFLYFVGLSCASKVKRYFLWLAIPFGWHAIFLTGSRGGLVGLAVTLLVIAFRSPKKIIGFLLIPLFIFAYSWQAGDVMKRRASTIKEYEQEGSAASRITAWKAALKMMVKHPFFGVGLASFGTAFPDFSDAHPRVAHNTFFQIAAESGIIAGLCYLGIIFFSLKNLIFISNLFKYKDRYLYLLSEACLVSLIGFFVCGAFLSLQKFELFFYLCLLVNTLFYLAKLYYKNTG